MEYLNKKKSIMFLGAGISQLPVIAYAQSKYHVITVDNRPDNPGHRFANESVNINTYDHQSLLSLAKTKNISGVSCFGSDPSVSSAAIIASALGLKGNSFESTEILAKKNLFRSFLKENGFLTPNFHTSTNIKELVEFYPGGRYIMKPVDSSASRGVFVINSKEDIVKCFQEAVQFSKDKQIILEEFIEREGYMIQGEGFVRNGHLEFALFGDTIFGSVNPFITYMIVFQKQIGKGLFLAEYNLVCDILRTAGFTFGGVNIEIIKDSDNRLFVVEIAPRSGGNFFHEFIYHAVGIDLPKIYIDQLMGKDYPIIPEKEVYEYVIKIHLHVNTARAYKGFSLPKGIKGKVLNIYENYKVGDNVRPFKKIENCTGILFFGTNFKSDIQLLRDYFPGNL